MSSTNQTDTSNANDANYLYHPNLGAAILFAVLFGLTFLGHAFHTIRTRSWWLLPLLIGLGMETEGYVFRYFAAKNFFTSSWAIISEVSIIVAPAFLCASEYMLIGRMMSYVGKENALIGHGLITKLFVVCDIIAIFSQAAGASMLNGTTASSIKIGRDLLIGALAFQVSAFGIFLFVAIAFHIKAKKNLGVKLDSLKHLFTVFYISAALIIFRSIYRTCEFASIKFDANAAAGYVLTHEWVVYVFDSVPMFLATAVFLLYHPTRSLPSKKGLRIDGSYEEPKPGFWARCCCCCCAGPRRRKAFAKSLDQQVSLEMATPMNDLTSRPQKTYSFERQMSIV